MLKLTNSFYRYLVFTCEKVNNTNVRRFAHLYCDRKTCSTGRAARILTAQFHSSLELRQHGHGKKRVKIKIPPLDSNECKKHDPMSDQLQPSVSHGSYGGQFDVSAAANQQWLLQGEDRRGVPPDINPGCRVWETVGDGKYRPGPTLKFKVLSYNLLAQYLLECHPYLYTDCSADDLRWPIRAARLFNEITSLSPDILCLQEVQMSHLDSFFTRFEQIGYTKIFKRKTGHRHDGCAIFFKTSMFTLQGFLDVEFNQPDLPILNRDNVGIMVKLVPYGLPYSPVVVATTHLLYNPKRTDVRLAQMKVFLAEIDRFAFFNNGKESGYHPVILTGDFNSTPDSAVIKLLDRGHVNAGPFRDGSDWRRIGVTDHCQHLSVFLDRKRGGDSTTSKVKLYNSELCPAKPPSMHSATLVDQYSIMFNSSEIIHNLKLRSVYDSRSGGPTAFQEYWVTVDYIYFSSRSRLHLVERLRLPTDMECDVLGRLPNETYGSDHLAVAAAFQLSGYRA